MTTNFIELDDSLGYYLYEVDTCGYEIMKNSGCALDEIREVLRNSSEEKTDVIVIAHGFNTRKNENGSIDFCDNVVRAMHRLRPTDSNPLYVCVHWPSNMLQLHSYMRRKRVNRERFVELRDRFMKENNIYRHGLRDGFTSKKREELFDFVPRRSKSLSGTVIFSRFIHTASTVGARGVHLLFGYLMKEASADVRFHAFGHSLGGQVVSSAAIGAAPGSLFTRKLHTLMVFQGAVGARAYSAGGPYRPLKSTLKPVAGPLLFTYIDSDRALNMYCSLHNEPVGKIGVADTSGNEVQLSMDNVSGLDFHAGETYSLNGNGVISSHSDYQNTAVIGAFWSATRTFIPPSGFIVTNSRDLPQNYWSSYSARSEKAIRNRYIHALLRLLECLRRSLPYSPLCELI